VGEQTFFAAGFVFVAVLTLALIRLGARGRPWAAGWVCLWVAGGAAMLHGVPGTEAVATVLGTAFATLLYAGTLRFLGRPIPRWLVLGAAGLAAVRVATLPWVSEDFVQACGGLVISAGALGSAVEAARGGRGGRRHLGLAAAMPLAALAAWGYVWQTTTGAASGAGVFLWLMAGILVGGAQVTALMARVARRVEGERAMLAALVEAVPVGLALFDRTGLLRAANPAFQKVVGLGSAPDERERRLSEVVEALREQVEASDADALPGGPGDRLELRFRSGPRVLSALHTVYDARGSATGQLWLLRDVSEERRLQESLERARRLETLGAFAGGVAHDFNNQLTSVLGNTTILREMLAGDHTAAEILADVEASAQHCARLTRDVLDFARRGLTVTETIELAGPLGRLVARYADGRAGRGARVSLALAPGTPPVRADASQLERVVTNLLENACEAVGRGGRVEVRAGPAPDAPGRVAVEVSDDGPGMDEAMRARVFDPFFTTKPVGQGTGLGLAIVYGIVSAQGGEVRVESEPGRGARFVTTWPAADRSHGG
jgi:signal transduction histidine kinase